MLADFGEERFAHRIARAIVEARSRAPITTTGALAKLVEAAVPKNRRDAAQHPATRTFQAVRIQVNHDSGKCWGSFGAGRSIGRHQLPFA